MITRYWPKDMGHGEITFIPTLNKPAIVTAIVETMIQYVSFYGSTATNT